MIASKTASVSVTGVIIAILAAALIGVASLIYTVYIPQVDQLNGQITDQQNQIASLNSTISGLNGQVQNLQDQLSRYTASLSTALGVKELVDNSSNTHYLYIRGYVTNNGITEAYNAGLHVVGYGANREVLINMTSPIEGGTYTNSFNSANGLSQLYPTQSQDTMLSIYHSGTVVSWDITAVWTNSP